MFLASMLSFLAAFKPSCFWGCEAHVRVLLLLLTFSSCEAPPFHGDSVKKGPRLPWSSSSWDQDLDLRIPMIHDHPWSSMISRYLILEDIFWCFQNRHFQTQPPGSFTRGITQVSDPGLGSRLFPVKMVAGDVVSKWVCVVHLLFTRGSTASFIIIHHHSSSFIIIDHPPPSDGLLKPRSSSGLEHLFPLVWNGLELCWKLMMFWLV